MKKIKNTHSEASTPLDVTETPHLASSMSRCCFLPLYPALAIALLSNITVGFPPFYTLQLTVDRLAPYCSSLHTGASFCLLYSTRQHWVLPSLRALPTSLLTQDLSMRLLFGPSPWACFLPLPFTGAA